LGGDREPDREHHHTGRIEGPGGTGPRTIPDWYQGQRHRLRRRPAPTWRLPRRLELFDHSSPERSSYSLTVPNTQSGVVPHASDDDEYVLLVSLPNNAGLAGDRRPRTHRYHSLGLALGPQLRAFREAHELSEAEVAHVLEASRPSISRWEAGGSAPDGL